MMLGEPLKIKGIRANFPNKLNPGTSEPQRAFRDAPGSDFLFRYLTYYHGPEIKKL